MRIQSSLMYFTGNKKEFVEKKSHILKVIAVISFYHIFLRISVYNLCRCRIVCHQVGQHMVLQRLPYPDMFVAPVPGSELKKVVHDKKRSVCNLQTVNAGFYTQQLK